jgi:hypothetical protein
MSVLKLYFPPTTYMTTAHSVSVIYTNELTWHDEFRHFSGDASDLSCREWHSGFKLVSHKTGIVIEFYLLKEQRSDDVDNEILWWAFKPVMSDVHKAPRLRDAFVRIYND